MIAVTGSTGHLGRLVIEQLLEKVPAGQIIALARNLEKAKDLAARGVEIRKADYDIPSTIAAALSGVDQLLLISSSELGKRDTQHAAVLAAAKEPKVKHLVYTSLFQAERSKMSLAPEHMATEKAIVASGIPHTILRNNWYFENHTENLGAALQYGVIMGAAKNGRISGASRKDYAAAAVAVLTTQGHNGKIYELAGDASYSMAELAAEVSKQSGKSIAYNDLPADQYAAQLQGFGLPKAVAEMLASADECIAQGELESQCDDLHRLIGRATIPLSQAVAAGLK